MQPAAELCTEGTFLRRQGVKKVGWSISAGADAPICPIISTGQEVAAPFLSRSDRRLSQDTVRPRQVRANTMPVSTLAAFPFGASAATFPQHSLLPSSHTVPTTPLFDGIEFDFLGSTEDAPVASSSSESSISVPQYSQEEASDTDEKPATKIARPPNAWILYRSTKLAEFKEKNPSMYTGGKRSKADRGLRPTQAIMSKQIGEMWAKEPPSVKDYFHREAMLRSVMHAVENPGKPLHLCSTGGDLTYVASSGYRFNPNKGRKIRNAKARSPGKSSTRSPSGSATPASSAASPARQFAPSSALAAAGAFQLSVLGPETMSNWASQASSASSHSLSSLSMATSPSLQSQLDAIFTSEQPGPASYATSSAGSYLASPLWTGGLMPALSIDERALSSSCPSPNTPLSEFEGGFSLPGEGFAQYAVQASPSFGASSYTFPQVQAAPAHASAYTDTSCPTIELDWWNYRHLKIRLDENGVPLEELLLSLHAQQEQQHFVRE